MTGPERDPGTQEHGNVFGRGWGNMFIHVQRETGLAHRTMVLRPWQVQALRLVASKWFAAVLTIAVLSWAYFAFQTARVPFLTQRITHLEQDAAKIDTLQATLDQLQRRYTQVQQMLSASARSTTPAPAKETKSVGAERKAPTIAPVQDSAKASAAKAPPAKVPLTKTPPATAPANAAAKVPPIAFLTTEHTEDWRRATEYCKSWGEDIAPRSAGCGGCISQEGVVLRGPRYSSVTSVVKKASVAAPSLEHPGRHSPLHRDPMRDIPWHC